MDTVTLGPDDGELVLTTDKTGPAAKTGHRLTITFSDWTGTVDFDGTEPTAVSLTVVLESLTVLSGEGGLTPMTAPEKAMARTNALKSLKASKFPQITYRSTGVSPVDGGYRLDGELTVAGKTIGKQVDVTVGETGSGWDVAAATTVSHKAVGLKPYSLAMGALKVADEVGLRFHAAVSK
ncbi:YceI family protein [Gordonia crocea]|uniref:Polyisoprenoid-binding protein n=1 Tax=Gordonia crocea TaxID=589162 RepID=A0A7I9UWQ4_9ACTN|nr:YceI family protein [Gordonia crocea]GED97221.1 polyisoprenoid-binding protein [Gordonia crocea]